MDLFVVDLHVADLDLGLPRGGTLLLSLGGKKYVINCVILGKVYRCTQNDHLGRDSLKEGVAQPGDDPPARLGAQHRVGLARAWNNEARTQTLDLNIQEKTSNSTNLSPVWPYAKIHALYPSKAFSRMSLPNFLKTSSCPSSSWLPFSSETVLQPLPLPFSNEEKQWSNAKVLAAFRL